MNSRALQDFASSAGELAGVVEPLAAAVKAVVACYRSGGVLYAAGNGGSMADAVHITGELLKGFELPRPLSADDRRRFDGLPDVDVLAEHLQGGLPATALGINPAISSAVRNDSPARDMELAQELWALGRSGDVLLGLSTSGNAANVCLAAQVARAKGMTVIALTGRDGGRLAPLADVAIVCPGDRVAAIQQHHLRVYHTLCRALEEAFFAS